MLGAGLDAEEAVDHELDLLLLRLPVPARQEWTATASAVRTDTGVDAPHCAEPGEVKGKPGAGRRLAIAGLLSVLMWGAIVLLVLVAL